MFIRNLSSSDPQPPGDGLSGLEGVPLPFVLERHLEAAVAGAGGSPEWRHRKSAEAHDILALSRLAPNRIRVDQLDLSENLRVVINMRAPVPTRRHGSDELVIATEVLLGLQYRREALLTPQAGASFVQILAPSGIFLPQVPANPPSCLCLAPVLPPGIRCKELLLLTYYALTMQTFQIDVRDPHGVFNGEAASWWQENAKRIPLTREPFLERRSAPKEDGS